MNEDRKKVDAYLNTLEAYVIRPIQETDLSESCIATILLIFAAIDGLGKLTHTDDNAGSRERFKHYLCNYMRGEYVQNWEELYKLRCSLAHNAVSFTSFISKTYMGEHHHLQHQTALGYLFVSSSKLFTDFCASIRTLDAAFNTDVPLLAAAGSRLQWQEDNPYSYWSKFSTPPGPATFISLQ